MTLKLLLKVILPLGAVIVFAVLGILARLRAERQDAAGGWVACGSKELVVTGGQVKCRACGYEGRLDRGGALSEQDFGAIHRGGDDRDLRG